MELGMIGLGRMGGAMAERLMNGGHRLVVFDPAKGAQDATVAKGAVGANSVRDLCQILSRPRAVWVMVPAGKATEETIGQLHALLSSGDILIDGGNSNYKESMRRAASLKEREVAFLDAGTSGGVWGLKEGYCLMVGGDRAAFNRMEPVFRTLSPLPDQGYGYVGASGSGHFVKMVHNGIEYGIMEAYAEGFQLMQAKREYSLDLPAIAQIWRHGSVVRSWLLDLVARALVEDPELNGVGAYVEDSGEGRWTVEEGVELGVPLPVISHSLDVRFRSRQIEPFGEKLLAALRKQFGGHPVRTPTGKEQSVQ